MTMGLAGYKPFSMSHHNVPRDNGVVRRAAGVQCHQDFCFKESGGMSEKWSLKCQFGHICRDYILVIWKLTPGMFYSWTVSDE